VDLDVGDLRVAQPALVVLDARVLLAVVLQHLGQAEELGVAVYGRDSVAVFLF
jgi:hypothetical protein